MHKKIILLTLVLFLSACGGGTKITKKSKTPSFEYEFAHFDNNETFFNTSIEENCIVFEINRQEQNCTYEYDAEFSDNLIKIKIKNPTDCMDSLGMHGLKGKICNLKKGEYKLQLKNLSKKVILE